MLRCPVDGSRLEAHSADGIPFSVCRRCSGVWFDRDALQRHTEKPLPLPSRQRRDGTIAANDLRKRHCPECTRRLTPVRIAGVDIDRCDGCGGIWLDAGEYEAIRTQLAAVRVPATAAPFGSAPDLQGFAAEAAFEVGLRAVFELLAEALNG